MAKRKEDQIDRAEQVAVLNEADEQATHMLAGNDERMTILDAAAYLGVNVNSFRNAIKHRPEFTASGVVIREKIPGSNYELVKISKSALDAYDANRKSGDGVRMRDGTRKFIVKLTADQIEAFKAGTLDTTTIELVPASQRAVKPAVAEAFDTEEDHGIEDQGDNDLSGASAEPENDPVIFAGLQDEGYQHNGQRW